MEILQLELYLLDEKEMLEAEQDVANSLNHDKEATMEMIQEEIGWTIQKLWLDGQQFSDLHLQWVEGRWTLERNEVPSQQKFHKRPLSCLLSLDCCARDCGIVYSLAGHLMVNRTLFRRICRHAERFNMVAVFDGGNFTISQAPEKLKLGRRNTLLGFEFAFLENL